MQDSAAHRPLGPAWEEILLQLRNHYVSKRPYSLDQNTKYFRLQMGPYPVTKFRDGEFVACQVAYKNGYLKWSQLGDNTSDVLALYGADPQRAERLNLADKEVCAPLDLIAVFRAFEPEDCWLYVTFGLSNLYATTPHPESGEYSGFGFELSVRVPCNEDDYEFPLWPYSFLHQYAKYVVENNCVFEAGQFIDAGGALFRDTPTELHGFVLALDCQLSVVHTASGKVEILQLIGVTRDELDFARAVGVNAFTEGLSSVEPLLITDYSRESYLSQEFKGIFHKPVLQAIDRYIEHDQLETAERAALALHNLTADPDDPLHCEAVLALAHVYTNMDRFDEAEPYYRQALTTAQHTLGAQHALVGSLHFALGNMYTRKDDQIKAETNYLKAREIFLEDAPSHVSELADVATYLGMIQLGYGNDLEAEQHLREALRLWNHLGETDADVVESLIVALQRQGKTQEAAAIKAAHSL